jgi:hypothetical protein
MRDSAMDGRWTRVEAGSVKCLHMERQGPVAQRVFKTNPPPTRSDTLEHDKADLAGISPESQPASNTLRHAGIEFSGGQEVDKAACRQRWP